MVGRCIPYRNGPFLGDIGLLCGVYTILDLFCWVDVFTDCTMGFITIKLTTIWDDMVDLESLELFPSIEQANLGGVFKYVVFSSLPRGNHPI